MANAALTAAKTASLISSDPGVGVDRFVWLTSWGWSQADCRSAVMEHLASDAVSGVSDDLSLDGSIRRGDGTEASWGEEPGR